MNTKNIVSTGSVAAVIAEWKDNYKIGHKLEDGKVRIAFNIIFNFL